MEGLGLNRFRLPSVLTNLARRIFGPLLYSRPPPRGHTRTPVNFNDFIPQNNNNNRDVSICGLLLILSNSA